MFGRKLDDQSVQIILDDDLTTQPTVRLPFHDKVKHLCFHLACFTRLILPVRINIAVTSSTTASPPTIGENAIDTIVDRCVHNTGSGRNMNFLLVAIVAYKYN
jgi:hypothetical protein